MDQRGGFVSLAQRLDLDAGRMLEASARSNPVTGSAWRWGNIKNQNLFNRSALEVLGVPGGNRVTPDKLGLANEQNATLFKTVAGAIDEAGGVQIQFGGPSKADKLFTHHVKRGALTGGRIGHPATAGAARYGAEIR